MDPATDDVANTYCDLHNVTTTCVAGVWAYGLNNAGQVAGQVYNLYGQDRFAFRTAPNSTVQTADRLFPNSTVATAINTSGQVLVDYDVYQSFRLTPIPMVKRSMTIFQRTWARLPRGEGWATTPDIRRRTA
jgi:hypothetical protein